MGDRSVLPDYLPNIVGRGRGSLQNISEQERGLHPVRRQAERFKPVRLWRRHRFRRCCQRGPHFTKVPNLPGLPRSFRWRTISGLCPPNNRMYSISLRLRSFNRLYRGASPELQYGKKTPPALASGALCCPLGGLGKGSSAWLENFANERFASPNAACRRGLYKICRRRLAQSDKAGIGVRRCFWHACLYQERCCGRRVGDHL